MIERGGEVRFFHIPDGKKTSIQPILDRWINSNTKRIMTDEASVYPFALDKKWIRKHRTVNHSKEYVVPGTDVHTNSIESAFSLLKRGLIGSFHFVSIKHLHRYLSEFEHRFNGRKDPELFQRTLRQMLQTIPMEYKQLTAEPSV